MNYILPAAGLGTRFSKAGVVSPKPLIPVLGFPMLLWVVWNLNPQVGDKIFIVAQEEHKLEEELGHYFQKLSCEFIFINIRGVTDGPASTLELALNLIDDDEPVICANTDQYLSVSLESFVTQVSDNESGSMLTMNASGTAWSYVTRGSNELLQRIVEKVEISNEATVGIYAWSHSKLAKRAIQQMKFNEDRVNNEFYVAPSFNYLIEAGIQVRGINLGDYGDVVHGIGTPQDYSNFVKTSIAKTASTKMSECFNSEG
jgi:NDP-sugar pyrophosphorylase family protein